MSNEQDIIDQEEEDNSSYEDAFNEFAGSDKAQEADSQLETEASTDEDDESPSTQDPDDGEKSPRRKGSETDAGKDDDPYAWINELPEEVRQHAEAMKHETISNRGRIRSYQSRLDEITAREAARAKAAQGKATPEGDASTQGQQPEEVDEIAQQIKEDYPQLAEYLDRISAKARAEAEAAADAKIAPLLEEKQVERVKAARDTFENLAAEVFQTESGGPYWQDAVDSPEFKQYYGTLTDEEKRLVHSNDPKTAANALARFVDVMRAEYQRANPPKKKSEKEDKREKLKRQAIPESRSAITDDDGTFGSYQDDFDRFADTM